MLKPYIIRFFLSDWLLSVRRSFSELWRAKGKGHVITVFINIRDPYSYLLLQILCKFQHRFHDVQYQFKTVLERQDDMFPAPDKWDQNAFNDGIYLSKLYCLEFPQHPPKVTQTPDFDEKITAQLLHYELQPGYLENALELFSNYWQDNFTGLHDILDDAIINNYSVYRQHRLANEDELKSHGHYLSATLCYGGEWYWGIDRIQYLERRFNDLGLNIKDPEVKFNLGQKLFCSTAPRTETNMNNKATEPLKMYWSIRSPYSYLGLVQAQKLCQHYKIPLIIKPVLPMVMRSMQVPKAKRLYIIQDANREAKACNIPFGFVADPLGNGVERCYALYEYAVSCNKGIDYLSNYARAVWAEGIDSATNEGLRIIVERSGLEWKEAKKLLTKADWRIWAGDNLKELYSDVNLWGVPSFQYKNVNVFGQDKIYRIEQEIIKELGEYA